MATAGCDEAGCGPAFGELVAAAVILPEGGLEGVVADSKRLSEARRNVLFEEIVRRCSHGIGRVSNEEIDAKGLAWARREVFRRALDDLEERFHPTLSEIIVDGTIFEPWKGVPHTCIPKADSLVQCVSAASIVAKVTRDTKVHALCDADPLLQERYDLRSNKGYLSAKHKDGIRKWGLTPWHRKSYNIRL